MPLTIDISRSPILKRLFDEGVRDGASDFCIIYSERRGFTISQEDRTTIKSFTEAQSDTFVDVLTYTKQFDTALAAAISMS